MHANKPSVYFGYRTALQIARTVGYTHLQPIRGEARKLPERAPSKSELQNIIEQMESSHPNISIERPVHLIIGGSSRGRNSNDRKVHVCTKALAGTSFLRLGSVAICAPPLAFIQSATQEPHMISLLELGWELCGTYQSTRTSTLPAYQVSPLTSASTLYAYAARNASIDGADKAHRALRYLSNESASPRETKLALIFGLPMRYGGYGLGIPRMNYEVAANGAARALSGKNSFRCDLCWPEAKLDVEYQSREMHEGEINRIKDSRRANALAAMGWTVIGITNDELSSLAATDAIAQSIYRHLRKRYRESSNGYHARKLKLRRQLGLPTERW